MIKQTFLSLLGIAAFCQTHAYDFPVFTKTLSNGLKIIVCEKPGGNTTEVQLWYKTGSKNETDATRGMAHMFEHMMFRGSENFMGEGDVFIDSMNAIGAEVNAYTSFDRTVYHETIPTEKLDLVLKMEADRMENLVLSQQTLDVEREVVGEEFRNGENNWFQRMRNMVYDKLYPDGHPYRVDVIGYLPTILSFTTQQCQEFYDKYYTPSNCILIVVGNIESNNVFAACEKHFGEIEKPLIIENRILTPDIFTDSLRQYEFAIDFPIQIYGYMIPKPAIGDSDFFKFTLLKDLLFSNQNSIIRKLIIDEMHAAYDIIDIAETWNQYTNYCEIYIFMQAAPGNLKVKKSINTSVLSIIEDGIDDDLISNYVNHLKASRVMELYNNSFIAYELGMAEVYFGDFAQSEKLIKSYEKISADDLQQTAEKYFKPENFKVVNIKPDF